MEAKDRKLYQVKKTIGYGIYSDKELKQYLEEQAETSFKAGRGSRKNEIEELMDIAFKDGERIGKKAGRREVMEWIRDNATESIAVKDSDTSQEMDILAIIEDKWRTQKEKWEIKC